LFFPEAIVATDSDPIVGNWYQHLDKGQKFEVVAVDEDQGVIEIQHFDGDLEEIDADAWYEMEIEPSEAPENWSGPMDSFEEGSLDYTETDMNSGDWNAPGRDLDRKRGIRKRRPPQSEDDPEEDEGVDYDEEEFPDEIWRDEE
jgi:hypothetical protein